MLNREKSYKVPSERVAAQQRLQFLQKGFYAEEALVTSGKYQAHSDGLLNAADPRATTKRSLFANPNHAVKVDC